MNTQLVISIFTMGGIAIFFASLLAIADHKLRTEDNPDVERVFEALPGANCGACGCAGCYDFAVSLVDGKASLSGCPVGGAETAERLAEILSIELEHQTKFFPIVLCAGGIKEAALKITQYFGPANCRTMDIVSGGNKLCFYGCLGGGDCVEACPFDAIFMNENGLPEIIYEKCAGCGICEDVCPRNVIEMHPENRNVFVFCKNHDDPKKSRKICKAACIGCGICARNSNGSIAMKDNLAVIDYENLDPEIIPFEKCSTKAIRLLENEKC